MVHGQQNDVILRGEPEQLYAQQWPLKQIERLARLNFRKAHGLSFPLGKGQLLEVDLHHCDEVAFSDHLDRLSVLSCERGAQGFMALNNFVEALLHCANIQSAG